MRCGKKHVVNLTPCWSKVNYLESLCVMEYIPTVYRKVAPRAFLSAGDPKTVSSRGRFVYWLKKEHAFKFKYLKNMNELAPADYCFKLL